MASPTAADGPGPRPGADAAADAAAIGPGEEDFNVLGLPRRRPDPMHPDPDDDAWWDDAPVEGDRAADPRIGSSPTRQPGASTLLPSRPRDRTTARPATRAGRAVVRRVGEVFGAGGPAFRVLATAHAASTAGDTLVAIALANTLFFAVPSSEARGNVALYLLLTAAPFAVIGPLLGWVLDRPTAERATLVGASAVRLVAALLLVWLFDTFWLFPLAFCLLVLSRVHGISRAALLPQALSNAIALVTANARLAQVSVLGGAAAVPVGAGLALLGPEAVLLGAAGFFALAVWQSAVLPDPGAPAAPAAAVEVAPAGPSPLPLHTPTPRTARLLRRTSRPDPASTAAGTDTDGPQADPLVDGPVVAAEAGRPTDAELAAAAEVQARAGGPRMATTTQLRLARFATAVVRVLNGFVLLLLAFAFREEQAPLADFGALLGAAGGGFGLAALVAPRLERALREEPMVVAALAVEAAAAFTAGQFFGLPAAAFLALAAGYAWGTAKFAFDGLLQATVAPTARGRAFTRSETVFAVAWVAGAFLPTALVIDVHLGLLIAGVVALVAQTLYVSRLLQRV